MPETDVNRAVPRQRETIRGRISTTVSICCARATLRQTLRIAAVVGLVLTAINEGGGIVHGDLAASAGIKIALNFVVPFIVSNLGVLAGRTRG